MCQWSEWQLYESINIEIPCGQEVLPDGHD